MVGARKQGQWPHVSKPHDSKKGVGSIESAMRGMEEKLASLFHVLFPVTRAMHTEAISVDSVPQWDSAAHVNLIAAIESEFDLFFDDVEALLELTDFRSVRRYVQHTIARR
jgi:acyl carrier protein